MDRKGDSDRVADAFKFLSIPWLAQKERSALERAKMATESVMAMSHEDEANRCRSTITQLQTLRADNAVLAAEVEAWRALIGPRLVGVLSGPLLVPSLLTQVTHTRHATDASGALDRAKEIK